MEEYPEDGGHWVGKNYTFDKRFSHGAEKSDVIRSKNKNKTKIIFHHSKNKS